MCEQKMMIHEAQIKKEQVIHQFLFSVIQQPVLFI